MARTMFVVARWSEHSLRRKAFITVPWVTALATPDPDERQKYYVLPDEEPEPPPAPKASMPKYGPKPRKYRETGPALE